MTIKSKLLEAVGAVDIADIGNEALVDILVAKIKSLEDQIDELRGENAHERQILHSKLEALQDERMELRKNPLYGAHGEYCFVGKGDRRYFLSVKGGLIDRLCERVDGVDLIMEETNVKNWYGEEPLTKNYTLTRMNKKQFDAAKDVAMAVEKNNG